MKKITIAFFLLFSIKAYTDSSYKKKWGYKSISCQLSNMSQVIISNKGKK